MPHQHRTTAPDGTTIAWSLEGSGPPVVLVHGITESAPSFDPITRSLTPTNQVVTMDLRGHGESGTANGYDLAAMVSDVGAVIEAARLDRPHLVGHSLGGAVVTAAGAAFDVASVVDIDQSLQLDSFKAQLVAAEPLLRDPEQYHLVVDAMFESMMGDRLSDAEQRRVGALRRADHAVVLGTWELLLTESEATIAATVDAALAGYADRTVPYLAIFGLDPGEGYASWLVARIPDAEVEYWEGFGHYPHLVDPDRFVAKLRTFWAPITPGV
jgi:pimeloyl-ACP methyl ester carboxylesterase